MTINGALPLAEPENLHLNATTDGPDRVHLGQKIFNNTTILLGGRSIGLLFSGLASIVLGRYLGRDLLGEYGAICAYLSLYDWLTTFGLEWILAREAAKNRQQAGSILLTGIVLSSVFSLVATIVALLLASLFGYSQALRLLLIFASVDLLVLAPLRLPGIVFQVDLRQWYGVVINVLRQLSWLLVVAIAAFLGAGLTWVLVGRMICGIGEVILILIATYYRGHLAKPWRFLPDKALQYAGYGFPIAVSALAVGIYNRIDQVMLHYLTTDKVLGGYVAAVNITGLFVVLPVALMTSLFPALSRFASGEPRFDHYLTLGFRLVMTAGFGICAVVSPLAPSVMKMVYGKDFVIASPVLSVLVWSEIPVFFGIVISNGLIAKNLQRFMPGTTAVGAIVNVLLNLVLIPKWGALGAAWATNFSYVLAGMLIFLIFRETRSMAWLGLRISALPMLLAVAIATLFAVAPLPAVSEFFVIVAAYGLGAWMMGIVHSSEITRIAQFVWSGRSIVRPSAI